MKMAAKNIIACWDFMINWFITIYLFQFTILKIVTIINNKNSNYYKKIIIIIDSTLQYGIVIKTVSGEVYKRITGTKNCFI